MSAERGGVVRTAMVQYRPWRRQLVAASGAATVAALTELAVVLLIAQLASLVVAERDHVELGALGRSVQIDLDGLILIGAAMVVVRFVAETGASHLQAGLVARYDGVQRRRVTEAMAAASWTAQSETRSGEIIDLLTTYLNQTRLAIKAFSDGWVALVSFVLMMAAGVLTGGVAALGIVVVLLVISVGLRPIIAWARRCGRALAGSTPLFATRITETVDLGRELKVFGVTDAGVDRVRRSIDQVESAWRRFYFSQSVAPSVLQTCILLLVVGGLGSIVTSDVEEPEAYIAVVLLLYRAAQYGRSLQTSYQMLATTAPFIERLESEIARFGAAAETSGDEPVGDIERLAIRDASFSYPNAAPVLEHASLELTRGEVVGLVGASGAGKTTLANLLLRLTQPTNGRIELNGRAMEGTSLSSWRTKVAFVPQEGLLLDDTVRENVRFLRAGITDEAIVAALASAQVLEEVEQMADGLDHQVGERGRRLSGGQRQRIAIARALVGAPSLLVFDEPTSALDSHSEQAFRRAIDAVRDHAIVVIIAHRPETLLVCDRLLRVADGAVSEVDVATSPELG